ncbi:hypothetical protein CRENBAI_015069 [Crenichthys baileyi]|uniref:Ig-like domain-containing protein n=1 Tax=Crenichthys baileyi TaxID=28760 RepID=A0AAV9QR72_9TELE
MLSEMKDHQMLMAALSENVLIVSMLLSVIFLPGSICNLIQLNWSLWIMEFFCSSKSVNIYPLEMIGNLTERNCTTLFPDLNTSYTDRYFFRIENGPFRATACADPLQITVKDAPRNTSASISPSGLVSAGSWVELNCSSRAKPPASFTWFRNSKHGAINVSVGQVYSFNVTEGGEFYCVARNYLGHYKSSMVSLQIKGLIWVIISAGGIAAICLVACLVVSVWCFRSKCPTQQQTQSQTSVEVYDQISGSETKAELHYGELIILKKTPEVSFISVQDGGQQETVYAQIQAENVSTQTADNPESLYAEVKKE